MAPKDRPLKLIKELHKLFTDTTWTQPVSKKHEVSICRTDKPALLRISLGERLNFSPQMIDRMNGNYRALHFLAKLVRSPDNAEREYFIWISISIGMPIVDGYFRGDSIRKTPAGILQKELPDRGIENNARCASLSRVQISRASGYR